jgi:GNAT superfamily N-acetyltransferase
MDSASIVASEWKPGGAKIDSDLDDLAELLRRTVESGSSVHFMLPFSQEEARRFWVDKVLGDVISGAKRAFVARSEGKIVGSALLCLDSPPNQRHRADVAKMLVHPDFRRRGIGRSLMQALETAAREENRSLLVLDTRTGSEGEQLYLAMGFSIAGVVPRFAMHASTGELEDATFMYKELAKIL